MDSLKHKIKHLLSRWSFPSPPVERWRPAGTTAIVVALQICMLLLNLLASTDSDLPHTISADEYALHTWPEAHGAPIQAASQVNRLEMTAPSIRPEHCITGYQHDSMQASLWQKSTPTLQFLCSRQIRKWLNNRRFPNEPP